MKKALLLLGAIFWASLAVFAQEVNFSGQVVWGNQEPAANILVTLTYDDPQTQDTVLLDSTRTDANGFFNLEGDASINYDMNVTAYVNDTCSTSQLLPNNETDNIFLQLSCVINFNVNIAGQISSDIDPNYIFVKVYINDTENLFGSYSINADYTYSISINDISYGTELLVRAEDQTGQCTSETFRVNVNSDLDLNHNFFLNCYGDSLDNFGLSWWQDYNNNLMVYFEPYLDFENGGSNIPITIDFGDGNSTTFNFSPDTIISHVYESYGDYTVIASLNYQNQDFYDTIQIYLEKFYDDWVDCYPGFYYYPTSSDFMTYTFENLSWANGEEITSVEWDFGDGETAEGDTVSHTYANPGVYLATITIYTDNCEKSFSQYVWAGTDNVWYPDNCQALFYVYYDADTVYFVDIAYGGNSQIVERYWDFGDGTDAFTVANPIHVYDQPGTYEVSYTIFTDNGCENTYTAEIYIDNKADSCLLFFPKKGDTKNITVKFHKLSGNDDDNLWVWDFGDSKGYTQSKGSYVVHEYSEPGDYHVMAYNTQTCDAYAMDITVDQDGNVTVNKGYALKNSCPTNAEQNDVYVLNVYPNPVKDILNVSLPAENTKILITDAQGKVIQTINANSKHLSVNTSRLTPGVYFLKVKTDKGIYTAKFVK